MLFILITGIIPNSINRYLVRIHITTGFIDWSLITVIAPLSQRINVLESTPDICSILDPEVRPAHAAAGGHLRLSHEDGRVRQLHAIL